MIHLIEHPLVKDRVNKLRKINLNTKEIRESLRELTSLLLYEATRDLPLKKKKIKHWLGEYEFEFLSSKKFAVVPILRTGAEMVEGFLRIIPTAKVGFIGFGVYSDQETLEAIGYYSKLPNEMEERITFILDSTLATGNTLSAAIELVKESGCKDIRVICCVAAPEGVKQIESKYPNIEVYVAAIDEKLNRFGYIVPGLRDVEDRILE